jgi:hypothetical protein
MKKDVTAKLAACEASLKRWQTRLKRAVSKVNELDRQRRRLQAQMDPARHELISGADQQPVNPVIDDLAIPPELRRTMEDRTRDQLAARTEAETDPVIVKVNRERLKRMDEKRRGRSMFDQHAMPLTGKAALEAIRPKRKAKA